MTDPVESWTSMNPDEAWDDPDLNADAIYAALVHVREYRETREGDADYGEALETARNSPMGSFLRDIAAEHEGTTFHVTPKFQYTPELLEHIYPGEPVSVEVGLTLAPKLSIPGVAEGLARERNDPLSKAVGRFIADRAH